MSTNRIPLNVDHFEESSSREINNKNNRNEQRFTREFRSSSTSSSSNKPSSNIYNSNPVFINKSPDPDQVFHMKNMINETDRIKNRMAEFEQRCRKWREEIFANSSKTNEALENDDFLHNHQHHHQNTEQRVPFTPLSEKNLDNPFSSKLHRSFIDDVEGGAKRYRIEFEIGDFKQNELMLSSNGNVLIISGDRELVAGSSTEKKTFNREVNLPDYVDMTKITANLIENSMPNQKNIQKFDDIQAFNNTLVVQAPILMEKYTYRRSGFDKSQSPIRVKPVGHVPHNSYAKSTTTSSNFDLPVDDKIGNRSQESQHSTRKTTTTTTKSTKTTKTCDEVRQRTLSENRKGSIYDLNMNIDDNFKRNNSNLNLKSDSHGSAAPDLISGYPFYDNAEGCVVYKFDLAGFDQSEIHLTITVDRVLEIKACKEKTDHLGKVYQEFKREITLEPEIDINLIKNVLHEGILTLKIPKKIKPDGFGSISNNHSLQAPNGFKEIFTDDGKLTRLNADFRGYNPENVKIVLSANNVLKVSALQHETAANNNGTVQKESTRQYTLPSWVQPENMKATMSRDGLLTIDFLTNRNTN